MDPLVVLAYGAEQALPLTGTGTGLSIHATYCVIIAGASPGETKMWAAVRENGDFLHLRFE